MVYLKALKTDPFRTGVDVFMGNTIARSSMLRVYLKALKTDPFRTGVDVFMGKMGAVWRARATLPSSSKAQVPGRERA